MFSSDVSQPFDVRCGKACFEAATTLEVMAYPQAAKSLIPVHSSASHNIFSFTITEEKRGKEGRK